jgi:hypothetical protein
MKAEVCLGPPEAAVGAPVKAEDRRLGVPGDSDLWNKDIVNTNSVIQLNIKLNNNFFYDDAV